MKTETKIWTLEKELSKLTGEECSAKSLVKLGLLSNASEEFQLIGHKNWIKSGSETYVFPFRIINRKKEHRYLLKACVALTPGVELTATAEKWEHRRLVLVNAGVRTPRLFAYADGVFLEEWIPFSLKDILLVSDSRTIHDLLIKSIHLHLEILKIGFRPISVLNNLRTNIQHVFYVDYGEDLGEVKKKTSNYHSYIDRIFDMLQVWNVQIPCVTKKQIKSIFFR